MGILFFRKVLMFVVLVLLQVLVLNYVHFLGYATPYLYVYLILQMRAGTPRNELLIWGFLTGLMVDIFSNTPGVAAAATTLFALVQPWLVSLFAPRDSAEDMEPGYKSMGVGNFVKYVIIGVLIQHTVLLTLETFSFIYWLDLIISILSSTLLTVLLVLAIEGVRKSN